MSITSPRKAKSRQWSFEIDKAAALLSLLANSKRIEIMRRLLLKEFDVTTLSREVELSQSALSQHLQLLRQAGVVRTRRSAQQIFYSSDSCAVAKLLEALEVGALSEDTHAEEEC